MARRIETHPEALDPTLFRPKGLSTDGNRAYDTFVAFLIGADATYTGGCTAFYSPQEWVKRGESYGARSVLIVVHDGGDISEICNLDKENYELNDRMNAALQAAGFYFEACTSWYGAIYKV